jgi:Uma2 family endonuclease
MATAPALDHPVTPEELLTWEDGTKYELVDGVPLGRHVSELSSRTNTRFIIAIGQYVIATGIGDVYDAEVQVRAFPWAPSMVRKPDAAFVSRSRPPFQDAGYLEVAPDWVLETVSISDSVRAVREKVDLWLKAGVRMVWVADPAAREVTVYRPGQRPRIFTAEDTITGEDVIAGFRTTVADLFPRPAAADA